jgi:hypothetical protein
MSSSYQYKIRITPRPFTTLVPYQPEDFDPLLESDTNDLDAEDDATLVAQSNMTVFKFVSELFGCPYAAGEYLLQNDPDSEKFRELQILINNLADAAEEMNINLSDIRPLNETILDEFTTPLKEALDSISFSDEYYQLSNEIFDRSLVAIQNDPFIRNAIPKWEEKNEFQRDVIYNKILKLFRNESPFQFRLSKTIELNYLDTEPSKTVPTLVLAASFAYASYSPIPNKYALNLHPQAKNHDIVYALCALKHEEEHALQMDLAVAYAKDILKEGDPLYEDGKKVACLLALDYKNTNSIIPCYTGHPMERPAFRQGYAFSKEYFGTEAVNKSGMKFNLT